MKRIGAQLVQERKLAFSEGDVESAGGSGKDLLSLLVKANMTDSEGSSMSDEDVQDRESTPRHLNFMSGDHFAHTLSILVQKSLHLLSLATRRAVRGSLGAFIVYPTISRRRSVCVTKFASSVLTCQIWSR